ncbi:short-chain dehydrogenase [Pseudomonas gingeri NCPPB 3146 = LMG 5327]|uniref:Short-chain dehydrogenase n=2 Tax=Pseudomonas gingeri TaxID=117681 RepID=A0A7Y7XYI1_9PSED|nr:MULTISPECIES: hypothetical protein [Pseudomonas]NVZ26327.1 short-chain dehydrogenase [Pseudomonas gingeri]NVZ62245.1 short-chain dehydrogenase [Pseudomonas gingeri]NVZ74686.1 short-chain dehydrogenase [Pseudomonas gingeri]NWA10829.1 short-chain dehydrogenase [Pseudomonas gingeri]NWC14688.1 short-chain dehydrogenase [Pseudomonas gingeri]
MNKYTPLTAIDCLIPSLLIDAQSPTDVLHANATARIQAATRMLESLARLELHNANDIDLQQILQAPAILLRDGCDLMDVLGWRLRA